MAHRVTGLALIAMALLWTGTAALGLGGMDNPPELAHSTNCEQAYKRYLRALYPHYFALSEDGKACGFTYCTSACAKTSSPVQALKECEGVSNGQPCSVYAFRGNVVSKTGVAPGGGQ